MNLNSSDHPFDLYKDQSRALIMERNKSKKSCLKRLGYWADLNFNEERKFTDKKGLIYYNKGETVAFFMNPCSSETLHLCPKSLDDSEQIIQPRGIRSLFRWYIVIWTNPPSRPKVTAEKKKKTVRTRSKNVTNKKSLWPLLKFWN